MKRGRRRGRRKKEAILICLWNSRGCGVLLLSWLSESMKVLEDPKIKKTELQPRRLGTL